MSDPAGADNKESHPASLAGIVAKNAAVAAALLYFLGWVYLHRYFSAFEIEITQLELSWNDVLVHSTILVKYAIETLFRWPMAPLTIAVIILAMYAFRKIPDITGALRAAYGPFNVQYVLPVIATTVLIYSSINFAQHAADRRALQTRQTPGEPISVVFKDLPCKPDPDGWITKRSSELRLERLFTTAKSHFFYVHTGGEDRQQSVLGRVIQIPSECIQAVMVRLR